LRRCVTLARMSSIAAIRLPNLSRRAKIWLVALLVALVGWIGYTAKYAECDTHSKFCVLDIAGTRSEIGFEWQGWHLYVSTSGADPVTHVLF
jgi:hypothetical protein